MSNLTVFGKDIIDDKCVEQIKRCIGPDDIGVLTPDAHYGYGHPIGGAVAYKNHISLSGVGFDIACGNKAVRTDRKLSEINIGIVMNDIQRRISFGMGRPNNEPVDHEVLDKIRKAPISEQRSMIDLAAQQLGTVGGGNHFVDLFVDDEGFIWIGVHFGSRGFGHKTAMGFIARSQGKAWGDRADEGSMDKPPILFELQSQIGKDYIEAMNLAGDYAYAGRDTVVSKVLNILDNPTVTFEVHNHHNFAWFEQHFGEQYCVVRKGCTPAFPGQYGFIGSNMRDQSVIIEGIESVPSVQALYSTVHGAGRILSRTQAAGKKKWIRGTDGKKRPQVVAPGLVNFDEVKEDMRTHNVELRGAGADEAPQCYKKLTEVLEYQKQNVNVVHRLTPVGVCMAGDEYDPYKD